MENLNTKHDLFCPDQHGFSSLSIMKAYISSTVLSA